MSYRWELVIIALLHTQAYIMEEGLLQRVAANKLGHFYTDRVHVVCYEYQKQSSLRTWTEGMLYVWVGAQVKADREEIVKEVLKETALIGIPESTVCWFRD